MTDKEYLIKLMAANKAMLEYEKEAKQCKNHTHTTGRDTI